jgi:hypothetical protein
MDFTALRTQVIALLQREKSLLLKNTRKEQPACTHRMHAA